MTSRSGWSVRPVTGVISPGSTSRVKRRASTASRRTASTIAKRVPMQTRGPPPNGNHAYSAIFSPRSASQRSGRNSSGSGNHRASRCVAHWLLHTRVPSSIGRPPIVAPSFATPVISQTAGYSRSVSFTTAWVYVSRA
ncbi:hypothetical protein SBADM41S_08447 [Streptomyces badius]